ncbi:L,D-transpeptidase [Leucothrix sargassi]|nr:L,D-transpeptidase [Leucothrix sargassi]
MSQQPRLSNQLDNQELLAKLLSDYPEYTQNLILIANIHQQRLYAIDTKSASIREYIISSAANGTGSQNGSGKTPLGAHFIREKFGDNAAIGMTFKGRVATGDTAKILTKPDEQSSTDNITTRILWLSGLEEGNNKGGDLDSYSRYIYIHGTDEEGRLGTPASHGCLRMRNNDVVELYELTPLNTLVYILSA